MKHYEMEYINYVLCFYLIWAQTPGFLPIAIEKPMRTVMSYCNGNS